jgi:hypothetical protein
VLLATIKVRVESQAVQVAESPEHYWHGYEQILQVEVTKLSNVPVLQVQNPVVRLKVLPTGQV